MAETATEPKWETLFPAPEPISDKEMLGEVERLMRKAGNYTDKYYERLNRAADEVKRIAGTMEWWISVAERLPEEGQRVMVVIKYTTTRFVKIAELYTINQWMDDEGDPVTDVTHWMPIPPLPTDEKAKE